MPDPDQTSHTVTHHEIRGRAHQRGKRHRLSRLPKVTLDRSAATRQLGGDLVYRTALTSEASGLGCSIWLPRRFELEHRGDVVSLDRAISAVPSRASIWIFSAKGQREAREAGGATLASEERQLIGPAVVRMVGVGVGAGARRIVKVAISGFVDQVVKLVLPPSEEVPIAHRLLQLVMDLPGPSGSVFRVSWADPGAPA